MKKLTAVTAGILFVITMMSCGTIYADSAPSLSSISFNNATIDDDFKSDRLEYGITLDDPSVTPTLKDYEINGDAHIFITYSYDDAKHQNGIIATLESDNTTDVVYRFNYTNPIEYKLSNNNLLDSVSCDLCEVSPELNDTDTEYKLYVPMDVTEIELSAATRDISATCEIPAKTTLNEGQELTLPITVTASNGETRVYKFKVTRIERTKAEIRKEMESPKFKSIAYGEVVYHKTSFKLMVAGGATGVLILIIIIAAVIKKNVKVKDDDEEEFFKFA